MFAALLAEVLRLAWWPTPAELASQKPAPTIAVLDFRSAGLGTEDDQWAAVRAADLMALHLERLGARVRPRAFARPTDDLARAGLDAVVAGKLASTIDRDLDTFRLEVHVKLEGETKRVVVGGVARAFDAHVAEAAIFVARAAGLEVPEGTERLLANGAHVFAVHRFLGLAELRYERGAYRQSAVMFDRARTFRREVFVPEAIDGRRRAEGALVATGDAKLSDRSGLAASAAERAEVDGQRGRFDEAEEGWSSFLRYTQHHARRWSLWTPLGERPVVVGRKKGWVVQAERGGGQHLTFDPRTGTVVERGPAIPGLVAATNDQFLTLRQDRLARLDEQLRPQWNVRLPLKLPPDAGEDAIELTSGLIGISGVDAVVWLEVSFGKVGQLALEVVPLASSAGGVVVLAKPKSSQSSLDLALLRPGKRTPAWRTPVERPGEVRMTRDIVLVVTPEGLLLLKTYNGKAVRGPLPLEANPRLIGAHGRYGCVGHDDATVALFDIIAGERTALVRGPGKGVACTTTADGVAVLYDSQDLVFYDRDGKLLDRARVDGVPHGIERGHPEAPGPIVVTSQGMFAFGEIPVERSRVRDVDGLVALARLMRHRGNDDGALAVATHAAMLSAGRIKEAETIRARILQTRDDPASKRAAAWARTRAQLAADPSQSVPPFAIAGR